MMIDINALIATFDDHDDQLDIDRCELIALLGIHLNETTLDMSNKFMIDYSVCPMHHCDLQTCIDDEVNECAQLRLDIEETR